MPDGLTARRCAPASPLRSSEHPRQGVKPERTVGARGRLCAPRRLCRAAATTPGPRAGGLGTSPGFGERDARSGNSRGERDAHRSEVDQRLPLGGRVAGNARLPKTAGSNRQRRRPSRLVQFELKHDFLKRLLEMSLHVTPSP